jgi:murein DD-endopeptidase MepM/ murein hydrolase activator NlpD
MHEGIDIAGRFGSPVVAVADGYVAFAGENQGYGKMVLLQHGFGISTIYGHLSEILVREGMKVRRGEMVGRMGSTGRSTGPHVHYEVRVFGVPTDPKKYFLFEDYFIP